MALRRAARVVVYVWAAPTTLVGLTVGLLTLGSGGRVQRRQGALEFHGGFTTWLLEHALVRASAMTLGHVILGRDAWCLDDCREHEQAHVRQVERWGGFFLPAYVLASLVAWARGRHYYYDNWFECDARRRCGEDPRPRGTPRRKARLSRRRSRTRTEMHTPHAPHTPHVEKHFTASESVRDIVIGMSDGLTVPFALAAGLTGTAIATRVIVTAGLAEIAAGSIAMGLGGFLAARSDAEHYQSERLREEDEVVHLPHKEREEVAELFEGYGLSPEHVTPILEAFQSNPRAWVDFMMRYELGLEEPDPGRALKSALTIAGAYVAGGLIPLAPYMLTTSATTAALYSVVVTLFALTIFGYIKGRFTGTRPFRSALQTAVIGGLAAAAAFGIAKVFA
jgi:VIT1/CCC1 family predicted Fe2+/Mn2+ transporter